MERKHNWFEIEGDIRTQKKMTTREFLNILDSIGLELCGRVGYSPRCDADYGHKEILDDICSKAERLSGEDGGMIELDPQKESHKQWFNEDE